MSKDVFTVKENKLLKLINAKLEIYKEIKLNEASLKLLYGLIKRSLFVKLFIY